MISKIKVYNRFNMEIVAQFGLDSGFPFCDRAWHLVSIHGSSSLYLTDERIAALKKIGLGSYLSLEFWDITDSPETIKALKDGGFRYILFTDLQAKQTVKFLEDRKNEAGDDVLVLHCDAGISRSGAISEFACELFGHDRQEFIKENPYLNPNPMVLRMLRESAGMDFKTMYTEQKKIDDEKRKKEMDTFLDQYGHIFV